MCVALTTSEACHYTCAKCSIAKSINSCLTCPEGYTFTENGKPPLAC